jgi:hypothetical protein
VATESSTILAYDVDVIEQLPLYSLENEDVSIFYLIHRILVQATIKNIEAFLIIRSLHLWLLHPWSLRWCLRSCLWRVEVVHGVLMGESLPLLVRRVLKLLEGLASILALVGQL